MVLRGWRQSYAQKAAQFDRTWSFRRLDIHCGAQLATHLPCADRELVSEAVFDSQSLEVVVAWLFVGSWSSLDLGVYSSQEDPCVQPNLTEDRGGIQTLKVEEKSCGKQD